MKASFRCLQFLDTAPSPNLALEVKDGNGGGARGGVEHPGFLKLLCVCVSVRRACECPQRSDDKGGFLETGVNTGGDGNRTEILCNNCQNS